MRQDFQHPLFYLQKVFDKLHVAHNYRTHVENKKGFDRSQ